MAQILEFPSISARKRERIERADRRRERRAYWDAMSARIMGDDPIKLPTAKQLREDMERCNDPR